MNGQLIGQIVLNQNEVKLMADYKSMYFALFNAVTDAIQILVEAQKKVESMYIESEDAVITAVPPPPPKEDGEE